MLIFVKNNKTMTFFHISSLFLIILIKISFYDSVDCDLINQIMNESLTESNFFDWIFGEDVNQSQEHNHLDHIKEEMEYHYGIDFGLDDKSLDLEQEMDFHIFNLHDFDKNKLLDGIEMLSMMDRHENSNHMHQSGHTVEYNTAIIDMMLSTEDTNNDGFLDYKEFKSAKSKHQLKGLKV